MLGCLSTASLFKIKAYSVLTPTVVVVFFFSDKPQNIKAAEMQCETFTGPGTEKCQCILSALFKQTYTAILRNSLCWRKCVNLACSVTNRNMVLVLKNLSLVNILRKLADWHIFVFTTL